MINQLKDALKALNKRNATTEELKEAEGFISDAAEAVGDLTGQWEDRNFKAQPRARSAKR